MKVCIEMTASEALKAIDKDVMAPLIRCCAGAEEQVTPMEAAPASIMQTAPAVFETAPAVPTAPALTPAPTPAAPIVLETPTVPTQAHAYTLDEISRAAVQLMDRGKQAELMELLKQFGVESVAALRPDQFGQFATELRQRGALI